MTALEGTTGWLNQSPEFLAVLFIVTAILLAFLVRKGLATLIPWVNRTSVRLGSKSDPMLSPEFSRLTTQIAFWGILLAGFVLAFSLLGDGEFSSWLERGWAFIARLLVALSILAAGHVLGSLTRGVLGGPSRKLEFNALPDMAYAAIAGAALLMALSHLGLDISFITQLVLVIVAVFFAGLALAFALGAKTLVANLAAGNELMNYKQGDRLRVDGIEGAIAEIHRTGVVLSTEEGLARIPAKKFAEATVIVLHQEEDDG